jgi:hypothetical protein
MSIDLDELWPPASSLIGLLFDTEDQFRQCVSVLDQDRDAYKLVNWVEQSLVTRKIDLPRLRAAGVDFAEVELQDPEQLSEEERSRLEWETIHSDAVQQRMAEMLRRPHIGS